MPCAPARGVRPLHCSRRLRAIQQKVQIVLQCHGRPRCRFVAAPQEKMCIRDSGSHTLHQRVKQVQAHGACQASLVPARRASYFIQPRQNHASAKLELRISARSIKPGAPWRRHDHAATGVVTGATRPSRTVGRGASRTLGPRRAAKGRSNRRMAGSSFRCDRSDSRRRRAR